MPSHQEYRFEDSPGLRPALWDRCKKSREKHLKRHKEIAELARQINTKNKNGNSVLTPAEVALAVHGYRELNLNSKRENLDKALVIDVQLREKLNNNPNKLPAPDVKNEEIKKVLTKLGVNTSRSQAKDVRDLYTKLAEAIVKDIDTTANESRETRKRQLGYYRYADQSAYNDLMELLNPKVPKDPKLVLVITDEEDENDDENEVENEDENEDNAQEEEQEPVAPAVVEPPPEQPAAPRARPAPLAIETGRPQRVVREGNMTFTFVPNTPRLPKPPADASKDDSKQ